MTIFTYHKNSKIINQCFHYCPIVVVLNQDFLNWFILCCISRRKYFLKVESPDNFADFSGN